MRSVIFKVKCIMNTEEMCYWLRGLNYRPHPSLVQDEARDLLSAMSSVGTMGCGLTERNDVDIAR